jgi:hypothetical protein
MKNLVTLVILELILVSAVAAQGPERRRPNQDDRKSNGSRPMAPNTSPLTQLRDRLTKDETRRHDYKYFEHRALSVTSRDGNYGPFNALSFARYWLNGRDCISNPLWDDKKGPTPPMDRDGCVLETTALTPPNQPAKIALTRTPSSIEPTRLPDGREGWRFVFPSIAYDPRGAYADNCSGATRLEVLSDASFAFVRTERRVLTDACVRQFEGTWAIEIPAGYTFTDDWETFNDGYTAAKYSLGITAVRAGSIKTAQKSFGREFRFARPVHDAITTVELALDHVERLLDINVNPSPGH